VSPDQLADLIRRLEQVEQRLSTLENHLFGPYKADIGNRKRPPGPRDDDRPILPATLPSDSKRIDKPGGPTPRLLDEGET
jgi:hypothetical protein